MGSNLLHCKRLGTFALRIGQTAFVLPLLMRLLPLLTRSRDGENLMRMPTYLALT